MERREFLRILLIASAAPAAVISTSSVKVNDCEKEQLDDSGFFVIEDIGAVCFYNPMRIVRLGKKYQL